MKYEFIGGERVEKENIDKVWGVIDMGATDVVYDGSKYNTHKFVRFWGRRGKKLNTKMFEETVHDCEQVINKKKKDGYVVIDENKLNDVYPEFQDDLEKTAVWAMLMS